ncbi:DUF7659 family protein [Tenacibaculum agarivorans]|uniref:DUF7659 family protein n=1 Tax=Tenacibaculum agarivorans TaxID=1908389 RepID=UPI00094BB282|nr:hypothetical protein [Tenacibaculum agarivorans]
MKSLCDYVSKKQSELFKTTGTFFAFSGQQFEESRIKGEKYTQFPGGMFCLSEHADTLLEGLKQIQKEGIQQDLEENGVDKIIVRELYNYETFLTYDLADVIEALEDYPITKEQIELAFEKEKGNVDWDNY